MTIVYNAFVELCCICIDGVTRGKFTSQDWQGEEQRTPHYRGHSRKKSLPVNKGYEMGVLSAKHWWCVSDFCRELAKHPHRLACGDVFVTSVKNLQNIDDVFVTSVKNLQNIADVFVTSVKNLQNILIGRLVVMCLWLIFEDSQNSGDVFLTFICTNLQNNPISWLVVMCLWLLLRTCKTSMMCLWLLLRTCKTSVMCLWLLWRTCKTSSLVDLWWCVWLLLRTCKTSVMCLWLLLRTCKTSVTCLWLLWRTCKTSSLVDSWWCVCDFCWGLAKQRRCVSNGVF